MRASPWEAWERAPLPPPGRSGAMHLPTTQAAFYTERIQNLAHVLFCFNLFI